MLPEAIYDASFFEPSHGFRQTEGLPLQRSGKVQNRFRPLPLVVGEGDIKDFDNIDHGIMVDILRKKESRMNDSYASHS